MQIGRPIKVLLRERRLSRQSLHCTNERLYLPGRHGEWWCIRACTWLMGGYRYGESGIETTRSCFRIPYGFYQKCAHVVPYDAEDPRLAGIPIMDISSDLNRDDSASAALQSLKVSYESMQMSRKSLSMSWKLGRAIFRHFRPIHKKKAFLRRRRV